MTFHVALPGTKYITLFTGAFETIADKIWSHRCCKLRLYPTCSNLCFQENLSLSKTTPKPGVLPFSLSFLHTIVFASDNRQICSHPIQALFTKCFPFPPLSIRTIPMEQGRDSPAVRLAISGSKAVEALFETRQTSPSSTSIP